MSVSRPFSSRSSKQSNSRHKRIEIWKANRNPDQAIRSKIPKWAHGLGLSSTALHALGIIHAVNIAYGGADHANATLAKYLDRHEGSVSRLLTECQRKGVLLPIYLKRKNAAGDLVWRRFLMTCCLPCVKFLAGLSLQDWQDIEFCPDTGANRGEVWLHAQDFVERCEAVTGAHIGKLRWRLHMEVGTDEIILDLAKWEQDSRAKKTVPSAASFQSVECEGGLNKNEDNCIHSDFQSELNKEPNAAGGVGSPYSSPQAQPISLLPEASPRPSAVPDPTPHVASTPLPVEAKKRGGGKFEADHPGVMNRIRALCGGDTDATWDATYTRAVQVFAKAWNTPHGPGDQALALLEARLPETRRKKLTLASLVYAQSHVGRDGKERTSFWAAQVHAAGLAVENAWDLLQSDLLAFESGPLLDGPLFYQLKSNKDRLVECLEKYAGFDELTEMVYPSDAKYVQACYYLHSRGALSRLKALHVRYADHLEPLCYADWHYLLVAFANCTAETISEMLGVSADRLLAGIRSRYAAKRDAVQENYVHAWVRFDDRANCSLELCYTESLDQTDALMQTVVSLPTPVITPEEIAEVENLMRELNLFFPPVVKN